MAKVGRLVVNTGAGLGPGFWASAAGSSAKRAKSGKHGISLGNLSKPNGRAEEPKETEPVVVRTRRTQGKYA